MFKLTHSQNKLLKQAIILTMILLITGITAAVVFSNSSFVTKSGDFVEQPIAFSHQTHAGDIGLDCRFCHYSVEKNWSAGMPTVETCFGCHREILSNSDYLRIVRENFKNRKPIQWRKVNQIADHVYFHHGKHIQAGVHCSSCHGDVASSPLLAPKQPFSMEYCLNCHKTQGPKLMDCYTCHR
ncbi:MAG: cytochrome c3 family protein [Bacteriovoracaceae bacterium]